MKFGIYQGRKVPLEKPIRISEGKNKFKVYVFDEKTGKVKLIRFGARGYKIKKSIRKYKKSYCARSKPLSRAGDKLSKNYWSRLMWECENA